MVKSQNPKAGAHDALAFVAGYLYRSLRYEARTLGIRWTALMVLTDLALVGPSTQRLLAALEQVREPTMTILLRDLRKRGWVTQERDPENGRVKLAAITSRGLAEMRKAGRFLRGRLEAELAGLSADDLHRVEEGLQPVVGLLMQKIVHARTRSQR